MMSLGVWVIADQLHLLLISEMRTLVMGEQVAWRNAEVDHKVRIGWLWGRKKVKTERMMETKSKDMRQYVVPEVNKTSN